MSQPQAILTAVGLMLTTLTLAALVSRGRYRLSYFFTAYLLAVWSGEALIMAWPDRFYRWEFWLAKETAYGVLKIGIGLELGALIFRSFPGARARARITAFLVIAATLAAMGTASPAAERPDLAWSASFAIETQSRLAAGTVWLLALTLLLVLWYNVPLDAFHAAILRGLAVYLILTSVGLRWVSSDPAARALFSYLTSSSYLALLGYWAWEAWRPPSGRSRESVARPQLQAGPGRDTL